MDQFKMDKRALSITTLDEAGNDLDYWLSRPPSERLAAVEFLRQQAYGYDPTTVRLQRVLEVAELDRG